MSLDAKTLDELLSEAKRLDAKATPGPWRVYFGETSHRKGSPLCAQTCGNGAVPIRTTFDTPEGAAKWGGEAEFHVLAHTADVEDVLAADGTHVICRGHDYDDYGYVSDENAEFIAFARAALPILAAEVLRLQAEASAK